MGHKLGVYLDQYTDAASYIEIQMHFQMPDLVHLGKDRR